MKENNKYQNGFLPIPIIWVIIIIGVVIVFEQYKKEGTQNISTNQQETIEQKQKTESEIEEERIAEEKQLKELQDLAAKQQNEINKLSEEKRQEVDLLKKCATLNSALARLNAGCPASQNYKPLTPLPKIENDIPSIIKEWRPRVAFIHCKVVFEGNNMGEQFGSGYILGTNTENGDILLLTNKHVIKVAIHYLDGEPSGISLTPTSCDIKIPGDSQFVTVYNDGKEDNPFSVSDKEDFGLIWIKTQTPYMKQLIQNLWGGNCKSRAELGEKILILGYPGIGDQNDITVTDGIISGYDGNYYITSAKIERGNSGGIAISLKNNCYLGIPTFAVSGSIESLARILNINVIFPN